jgi:hypothetical protein
MATLTAAAAQLQPTLLRIARIMALVTSDIGS